ncbi:MAG: NAD(P)-dependent oxidoreductase, partial [Gemmataceae bacterium]|nr:NAD(P)-dependent oxidoreductase [Gemmataceae bacterium]
MALTKAEPEKTRVGWIGTGVMGRWMCQHLMDRGYKATVYNRTKDRAKPLLD